MSNSRRWDFPTVDKFASLKPRIVSESEVLKDLVLHYDNVRLQNLSRHPSADDGLRRHREIDVRQHFQAVAGGGEAFADPGKAYRRRGVPRIGARCLNCSRRFHHTFKTIESLLPSWKSRGTPGTGVLPRRQTASASFFQRNRWFSNGFNNPISIVAIRITSVNVQANTWSV